MQSCQALEHKPSAAAAVAAAAAAAAAAWLSDVWMLAHFCICAPLLTVSFDHNALLDCTGCTIVLALLPALSLPQISSAGML
jgi:hypothetical protein